MQTLEILRDVMSPFMFILILLFCYAIYAGRSEAPTGRPEKLQRLYVDAIVSLVVAVVILALPRGAGFAEMQEMMFHELAFLVFLLISLVSWRKIRLERSRQ